MPQTLELAPLLPCLELARVGHDEDRIAPEVAKLILDRGGRIGIADFPACDKPTLTGLCQRLVEPLARLGELAVDVRYGVVQVRGKYRSEHVKL